MKIFLKADDIFMSDASMKSRGCNTTGSGITI